MVSFRKMAVFIALAGLMVGLVSIADAARRGRPPSGEREITGRVGKPEMVLQGPVVSVEPNVGFLVMRHGAGKEAEEIPVEIDAKTTLRRAGASASLSEVRPGDRVTIHYSGQPGDVSKTVDVAPGSAARPARRARTGKRAM
jgi:hypothetical protein